MKSEIPEIVWTSVGGFCRLAIGRPDEVRLEVLEFAKLDAKEKQPARYAGSSAELAYDVALLAAAAERLAGNYNRRVCLWNISRLLSMLELPIEVEISAGVLILGDWETEAPVIQAAWERVKSQWQPDAVESPLGLAEPVEDKAKRQYTTWPQVAQNEVLSLWKSFRKSVPNGRRVDCYALHHKSNRLPDCVSSLPHFSKCLGAALKNAKKKPV